MRRRGATVAYLVGTALLSRSLAARSGSRRFYVCTYATAGTWVAGALLGPRTGPARPRETRPGEAIALGFGAFGAFAVGARIVRRVPPLRRALAGVLRHVDAGSTRWVLLTTAVNGVAEELFFRGTLYDPARRHPVARSTTLYIGTVAATGNPALTLASAVMGLVFAWQRRRSGGVTAPILTHLTWSTLMVRFVAPLFPASDEAARRGRPARPSRSPAG